MMFRLLFLLPVNVGGAKICTEKLYFLCIYCFLRFIISINRRCT